MTAPERVSVTAWGELRGEKKLPGVLRVLVGGQHAGGVVPAGGSWAAQVHGLTETPQTTHETAADAVTAVLRSSWGRRLGARAASRVSWSERALATLELELTARHRRDASRGGAR